MTADELAQELYAAQGYFIVSHPHLLRLGQIKGGFVAGDGSSNQPTRIVATSSLEEWDRQAVLAERIMGCRCMPPTNGHHFYRVESD